MSADLYAALKLLLLPPTSLMLLAAAGLLLVAFGRRGGGLALLTVAVVLLWATGAPFVATRMLASLEENVPVAEIPAPPGTGTIIVLAGDSRKDAPEYGGPSLGPMVLERLRYAARLQRLTGLPILVSGGFTREEVAVHADLMRHALVEDFGAIVRWAEGGSANTFENAALSAELLRWDGIGKAYLVTHAWHMPRAAAAFTAAGIEVVPAPTAFTGRSDPKLDSLVPTVAGWAQSYFAMHEWAGRIWYEIEYAVDLL